MAAPTSDFIDELLSSQDDLSSVGSENDVPDAYAKLGMYQPQNMADNTAKILSAFLDHLPDEGKLDIAKVIHLCDEQKLRSLSLHLTTAILLPSKINLFYGFPKLRPIFFFRSESQTEHTSHALAIPR
jgi:hypothetical protein